MMLYFSLCLAKNFATLPIVVPKLQFDISDFCKKINYIPLSNTSNKDVFCA